MLSLFLDSIGQHLVISVKGSLGCLKGADTNLVPLISPDLHICLVGPSLLDVGIDLVTGPDLLGLGHISVVGITDHQVVGSLDLDKRF